MSRENDVYPVTCTTCGNAGTLAIWRENAQWGVEWTGFRGAETLRSMPRRARATCLSCKGRVIQIGEPIHSP